MTKRILVIDSHLEDRVRTTNVLTHAGCDVVAIETYQPQAVLELVGSVDLILIGLQEESDEALALSRELSRDYWHVVSARSPTYIITRLFLQAGALDIIAKSEDTELVDKVQEALDNLESEAFRNFARNLRPLDK